MLTDACVEMLKHPNNAQDIGQDGRGWILSEWSWDESVGKLAIALGVLP